MYEVDRDTKTCTWNRVFAVLGVRVVLTNTFLGWFESTKACSVFWQEQKFDTIVAKLDQVVQTFDRGLIIC